MFTVPMLMAALTAGVAQGPAVVTTITTYAAIAREIVGDRGSVTAIARGDEDAHYVQPKPSYVTLVRDADLFVTTGLDLELWVPALMDRAGNRRVLPGESGYVSASAGIDMLDVPTSVDRSQGDIHIFGNPHLTSDPLNAIIIARSILAGLERVAPGNASYYQEREEDFERRVLEALIGQELLGILTPPTAFQLLSSNRLYAFLAETPYQGRPLADRLQGWFKTSQAFRGKEMVCYHKEWSYFSRRFGIPCIDYVEVKPGIPPSPGHVRELVEMMRSKKIPAILAANYYPTGQVTQVASRTGATAVVVPENTEGEPNIHSYFDLVSAQVDALADAFQ